MAKSQPCASSKLIEVSVYTYNNMFEPPNAAAGIILSWACLFHLAGRLPVCLIRHSEHDSKNETINNKNRPPPTSSPPPSPSHLSVQ